ncbi:MAG TPA: response regulator [Chthoniobacterales bacterium]|nr:response regulator [Chthoniobacterales bacterium]
MRILLVEDHQDTRQILTRLLTHWGFDVATAENLQRGLDELSHQPFDVLLSDIGLPDGTGYALVNEARRRGGDLLAIALSGFGFPTEKELSLKTGFDHHLTKPFDCQQLRSLLEQKIERTTVQSRKPIDA